jgi:hypothetical protein
MYIKPYRQAAPKGVQSSMVLKRGAVLLADEHAVDTCATRPLILLFDDGNVSLYQMYPILLRLHTRRLK